MSEQAWIIMTQIERDRATDLDDENTKLGARFVDNLVADSLGLGILVGKWVAPARLLYDLDYRRWVEVLDMLPVAVINSNMLFSPTTEPSTGRNESRNPIMTSAIVPADVRKAPLPSGLGRCGAHSCPL